MIFHPYEVGGLNKIFILPISRPEGTLEFHSNEILVVVGTINSYRSPVGTKYLETRQFEMYLMKVGAKNYDYFLFTLGL